MPKRKTKIYHENDLAPWFLEDHATLPASYVKSCRKFFKEISDKPQAASHKPVDKLINKG